MKESYGTVTALEPGQILTDVERAYKDFYIYDLKHDVCPIEVSNTVFLSGPFQYRITVDKTGYYLFRANVLDEDKDCDPDTGETRVLTGYFTLKNKKGEPIETYYFRDFRETIPMKEADSYNDLVIGYGPEDVKRPLRYKVIMYLEKRVVYTGQLLLNSSKNTDKECVLRLSPNADIYQYNSPNLITGTKDKNGKIINGLIKDTIKFTIGTGFITKPMNISEKEAVYTSSAEDGLNCVLMWVLNPDKMPPPDIKKTLFTESYRQCILRLYVDQFLGAWIYTSYDLICKNIDKMTDEQKTNDNIWRGIKESILSTIIGGVAGAEFAGFPGMLAGAGAGLFISIAFTIADNAKDTQTELQKLVDALSEFMDDDFKMKKPLVIEAIEVPTLRYGLKYLEYDFPVKTWNGSVYTALGEYLCCGDFQYNKYAGSELAELKSKINEIFKEPIE